MRCRRSSFGFTLVELLVVIAIIGVMVSLLLPAIQSAREAARRSSCTNNLRQQIVALHEYEFAHEHFPAGVRNDTGPIRNVPEQDHLSWIAQVLPQLGEGAKARQMTYEVGAYHKLNDPVRQNWIEILMCPSYWGAGGPVSTYAGVHHHQEAPIDADNQGVLFLNSRVTFNDLIDGPSYTIVVGEKLPRGAQDLGWMSGTPATLRNTGSPLNLERTWSTRQLMNSGPVWTVGHDGNFAEPEDLDALDDGGAWTDDEREEKENYYYEESAARQGVYAVEQQENQQQEAEERQPPPTESDLAGENESDESVASNEQEQTGDNDSESDKRATAEPSPQPNEEPSERAIPTTDFDANGVRLNPFIRRGGNPRSKLSVGGFGSSHPGIVSFAYADGSVQTVSESISKSVLQALANRNDGQVVGNSW